MAAGHAERGGLRVCRLDGRVHGIFKKYLNART
ncbi:hypothetical protein HNP29_002776 [Pseudomonas alcaligenes]|nr:hypothetical protein [Pseudomonas alcaligenes]